MDLGIGGTFPGAAVALNGIRRVRLFVALHFADSDDKQMTFTEHPECNPVTKNIENANIRGFVWS